MSVDFTLTPADKTKKDEPTKVTPIREKPGRRRKASREAPAQRRLDNGVKNREELGSWLWGAADILRGAVSADDYGDFVPPLVFYKRLSDNYSFEYQQRLEKYKDEKIPRDDMFYRVVVPDGGLWEDIRKTATNVGSKLNDARAPTRAGEFYTPREVVKVLVGCLKPEEGMEVYDPCCGSGGMRARSRENRGYSKSSSNNLSLFFDP